MAIVDTFSGHTIGPDDPIVNAATITTNNANDLPVVTRKIYVGTAGDLKVDMLGGGTVTLKSVPVGWHDIRVRRVYATGTTATDLVAGW